LSVGPLIAGFRENALLALVRQPAAGGVGAARVNSHAALLDVSDLAIFVNNEGDAIGDAHLGDQHSIQLGDLAHVVAEHGVAGVQFLFPMLQGSAEIGADGEDLGIILIEISDTRLVRSEFLGSTTGESSHEEGQNDDFLPAEIGELDGLVVGVG